MSKKSIILLPETEEILEQMGLQIKYARLRRKLTAELVAERAGISRATLVSIEKGAPSVAIGCYDLRLFLLTIVKYHKMWCRYLYQSSAIDVLALFCSFFLVAEHI